MRFEDDMKTAIAAALAGEWDRAHRIVQEYGEPLANQIHAVLHKIEGDEWNSRYWYKRSAGAQYEDFADPEAELHALLDRLS